MEAGRIVLEVVLVNSQIVDVPDYNSHIVDVPDYNSQIVDELVSWKMIVFEKL
jgi:hypothetical protein